MAFTVENLIRIYDDEDGNYLQISPDSDSLGMIDVKDSTDNRNAYALRLTPKQAVLLSEALMKIIDRNQELINNK